MFSFTRLLGAAIGAGAGLVALATGAGLVGACSGAGWSTSVSANEGGDCVGGGGLCGFICGVSTVTSGGRGGRGIGGRAVCLSGVTCVSLSSLARCDLQVKQWIGLHLTRVLRTPLLWCASRVLYSYSSTTSDKYSVARDRSSWFQTLKIILFIFFRQLWVWIQTHKISYRRIQTSI